MFKGTRKVKKQQGGRGISELLARQVYEFTKPLLQQLGQRLDRRLVQTFFDLLVVIVMHRDRHQGLLLSELGGQLMGVNRGPAGTKRIANLLHCSGWEAQWLEQWMWEQGDRKVDACRGPQEDPYVIWDESELEKPESLKAERLCPVRSTKARRLKRIKPGYYNPPGGRPVFVPGFH